MSISSTKINLQLKKNTKMTLKVQKMRNNPSSSKFRLNNLKMFLKTTTTMLQVQNQKKKRVNSRKRQL